MRVLLTCCVDIEKRGVDCLVPDPVWEFRPSFLSGRPVSKQRVESLECGSKSHWDEESSDEKAEFHIEQLMKVMTD